LYVQQTVPDKHYKAHHKHKDNILLIQTVAYIILWTFIFISPHHPQRPLNPEQSVCVWDIIERDHQCISQLDLQALSHTHTHSRTFVYVSGGGEGPVVQVGKWSTMPEEKQSKLRDTCNTGETWNTQHVLHTNSSVFVWRLKE